MKEYDEIYIEPVLAKQKMKLAQEQRQVVYIFGVTGIGKTIFIKKYLGRRKYQYFDGENVTADELEIPKSEEVKIVVVDNLQLVEPKDVRDNILELAKRSDIWLILAGKGEYPAWLIAGY